MPPPGESTCYGKCFLIKSQPARNVGREQRAACSGSVYYVLTALFIVEVSDIIPLCMVMKQLNEDSISQAVSTADELLQICATTCDSVSATTPGGDISPATFSVPGRGEGAEGQKGGRIKKRTVY